MNTDQTPIQHSSYNLRDFLTILFRRWKILAYFTAGVVAITLVSLITSPPQYEVSASILLKKERARVPLAPTESSINVYDELREEDINSEVSILTSRFLIERTLENLGISNKPEQQGPQSIVERLASALGRVLGQKKAPSFNSMVLSAMKSLKVEPLSKSNIINLSFVSDDPVWAKRFMETLIRLYQDRRTELHDFPGAKPFFKSRMVEAAARLESAENAMQSFLSTSGLTIIDGPVGTDLLEAEKRKTLETYRAFDMQLKQTEMEAYTLQTRINKLKSQIADESARLQRNLLESQKAKLIAEIDDLSKQEAQLLKEYSELQTQRKKVTKNFKKIRELEDKLRGLLLDSRRRTDVSISKEELDKEVNALYEQLAELGQLKRYDLNVGHEASPHEELETRIIDAEVKLSGLRERKKLLTAQLATYQHPEVVDTKLAQYAHKGYSNDQRVGSRKDSLVSNGNLMSHEGKPSVNSTAPNTGSDPVWQLIEKTQEKLSAATEQLKINTRELMAPVFQKLVAQLVSSDEELEGVMAKRQALDKQVRAYGQLLSSLNRKSGRLKELDRKLKLAQNAYLTYTKKYDTATISAEMTKQRLINTSVSEPPSASLTPIGMSKLAKLALSMIMGIVGGLGLVLFAEYVDHTITTGEDLERRVGLVHLASIGEGEISGVLATGIHEVPATVQAGPVSPNNKLFLVREGAVPSSRMSPVNVGKHTRTAQPHNNTIEQAIDKLSANLGGAPFP